MPGRKRVIRILVRSARFFCGLLAVLALLLPGGCRRTENPGGGLRTVSPRSVQLAGIRLYEKKDSLLALLPDLGCAQRDHGFTTCLWRPAGQEREGLFHGIEQLALGFYNDSLQSLNIRYLPMMDAEYRDFERGVREKYAGTTGNPEVDSTTSVWQYDSLIITLVPNRKLHWTGSLFTYAPVLQFQERSLYRRWMDALEQEKSHPLY